MPKNNRRTRTAIVTGVTSGFGKAIAMMLLDEGYKVYGLARRANTMLKSLENKYQNFEGYSIDLRNKDSIAEFFQNHKKKEINLLINNAGLALDNVPYDQTSIEAINTMMETNINSLVYMTRYFLECKGKDKYIINIGSIAGNYAYPNSNIYGATKAFVNHFSKNLRSDLVGKDIRVTCLEPGLSKTNFSMIRFRNDIEKVRALYTKTKYIKPEDIALIVKSLIYLPKHINVNTLELMPITQAWGPLFIHREK